MLMISSADRVVSVETPIKAEACFRRTSYKGVSRTRNALETDRKVSTFSS